MRTHKTRNVSLTPELEALVDSKVVRAALWLLDERERRMERKLQTLPDPLHAR
jgi:Arc/MetJ-type ribon-helix-helix transcriptional regulator